jgi:outer membrane receptor for ferrienterochelin and colicin
MALFQPAQGNIFSESKQEINTNNLYSNLSIHNTIGNTVSYRGGLSHSVNTSYIKTDDVSLDTRTNTTHAKLVLDHDISESIQLKYGGEWMKNSFEESISDREGQLLQKSGFSNQLISPFAEADVYFSNKLMARLGTRYEYNDLLGTHNMLPRISVAYKMRELSQLSLAFGRFSQLPIAEFLKYSDDLVSETASHYILNYQFSREGRIFRSEVYYKKYDQLATVDHINSGEPGYANRGYGDAKGFELFWRDSKSLKAVDYWISYSFLDTKRKYSLFPYQVMPYYASTHNLSVVYKHFISSIKSQIGWTYSFASGRPYTDPNTGEFNSKMTKNYNDFSLNYSYLVKPNMIIHGSMSNVFGFNNVFGYQYNSEPNTKGVYESIPIEPQAKRFIFVGIFITISKDKNANQLNNL